MLGMGRGLSHSMTVGKYTTFLRTVSWFTLGSQCDSPKFSRLSLYQFLFGHLSRSSLVIGVSPMSEWGSWGDFQCLYASSCICGDADGHRLFFDVESGLNACSACKDKHMGIHDSPGATVVIIFLLDNAGMGLCNAGVGV